MKVVLSFHVAPYFVPEYFVESRLARAIYYFNTLLCYGLRLVPGVISSLDDVDVFANKVVATRATVQITVNPVFLRLRFQPQWFFSVISYRGNGNITFMFAIFTITTNDLQYKNVRFYYIML